MKGRSMAVIDDDKAQLRILCADSKMRKKAKLLRVCLCVLGVCGWREVCMFRKCRLVVERGDEHQWRN